MTELEKYIRECNESYRKGEPKISDTEYDSLVEELKLEDPKSSFFKKGVVEKPKSTRMQKLPIPMFSLEKVKTIPELKKFIKQNWNLKSTDKIVITHKYDGISLCVDEFIHDCWTRGDGEEGQISNDHYKMIDYGGSSDTLSYTFGEAVIPIKNFSEDPGQYKCARNCVAGLFNSDKADNPKLRDVVYVRYGSSVEKINKSSLLNFLSSKVNNVAPYWVMPVSVIEDPDDNKVLRQLDKLFDAMEKFKCDGLVIEVDSYEKRIELGRFPNNNPRYAVAYKNPEWNERAETKVKSIEWNVSKDGKVKPVLIIEPVELAGATVSRATGYNANYICDNHICEGATVLIARSGDVIPKHLKTVSFNMETFRDNIDDMMICPSCGQPLKWDENMVDLICTNFHCYQKRISSLVYFFETVGVEEFGEPSIIKMYNAGYKEPMDILSVTKSDIVKIDGFGNGTADILLPQFKKILEEGLPLSTQMTAYNVFKGVLGEPTCQFILNNLPDENLEHIKDNMFYSIPVEILTSIKGVGEITANAFNKGMKAFGITRAGIPISKIAIKMAESALSVCFSGFRNAIWEKELTDKGHKVVSGVSKDTNYLVLKDPNSTSGKAQKARSYGTKVVGLVEFENILKTL